MKTMPSLFWPLQLLITVMGLCLIYQLVELQLQRIQIQKELVQLYPAFKSSLEIEKRLSDLAQDLLKTSANDPGAAELVKDFQIQVKAPEKGVQGEK